MPPKYNVEKTKDEYLTNFKIDLPGHMAIISRSMSGKSYLMERILANIISNNQIDSLLIMSDTVSVNDDYKTILAPMMTKLNKYYMGPWNKQLFEKYIKRQRELPKSKRLRTIILLDDVVPVLNVMDLQYLSKQITTIRHYNISLFISVQKANSTFTPSMRQNMHYVMFSKVNGDNMDVLADTLNIPRDVVEDYCSKLDDYEFGFYYNKGTRDYTFIKLKAVSKKD